MGCVALGYAPSYDICGKSLRITADIATCNMHMTTIRQYDSDLARNAIEAVYSMLKGNDVKVDIGPSQAELILQFRTHSIASPRQWAHSPGSLCFVAARRQSLKGDFRFSFHCR
jgi:hypothetical protein